MLGRDRVLEKSIQADKLKKKKEQELVYNPDAGLFSRERKENTGTVSKINWFIVSMLIISPLIISIISAIHIYEFFQIGNSPLLAGVLAGAFEFLTMSALVAIWEFQILTKATRVFLWLMMLLLVFLMIAGNVYSTWLHLDVIQVERISALLNWNMGDSVSRVVAVFQGAILPITSLGFIKILVNYIIKRRGN